jgi:hypothetical protein
MSLSNGLWETIETVAILKTGVTGSSWPFETLII